MAATTESVESDPQHRRTSAWRSFPSTRWSLLILVAVYLPMALAYSLLTRAYEGADEEAHVKNIEYIVSHHALPRISVANGLESHQPPLYYLLEAGWQDVLGIAAFTPVAVPSGAGLLSNQLLYSTHYTATQHADAVHVHDLRLLSVPFGLATVLLTFSAAKIVGIREVWALGCGLFAALYPKNLIASSTVTNDALMIPLCALAFVLFLLSERAALQGRFRQRRIHLLGMGLVLGAATITKLNSLTICVVLFALAALPAVMGVRRALEGSREAVGLGLDVGLALVGYFSVSGWWFLQNHHLYGQFLATNASEQYLRYFILYPHPWSQNLLFHLYPRTVEVTTWYNQPNLSLPDWLNVVMAVLVVPCLFVGVWAMLRHRRWISRQSLHCPLCPSWPASWADSLWF